MKQVEGYTIRRTLKLNGTNIGVYFKDNESPPLFVISDIARMINGEYTGGKSYVAVAGENHCVKIKANTSYTIWVCDFEGLCNMIHEMMSEEKQPDIIETVNSFVSREYETIPGPLTVQQGIGTAVAKTFDAIAYVMDKHQIRYVTVKGKVYFAAQDIRRCFQKDASYVEEKFALVQQEDKLNVTFNDKQTRLCLNSNGVETVINQMMDPDIATRFMVELISKCKPKSTNDSDIVQSEEKREDTTMKNNRSNFIKTTGDFTVIAYDYIEVNGKHILTCFAKRDLDNPNGKIVPLFWATALGLYTGYGNVNRLINDTCDKKDYCKVSIPDIKKYNIKVVTLDGIRSMLKNPKFQGEGLISALQDAMDKYTEQHKDDLNFDLEKYNTRRKASVDEEIVTETAEETTEQEEKHDINLSENVINFRGQPLRISIEITNSKGAIIYYDVKQLCDILGVKEEDLQSFNRKQDNQGNASLISIYDLADVLAGVTDNPADIVQELFDISKPVVISMADSMGLKVKDNAAKQEDLMVKLLGSSDGRNYTLGAIILAERFREVVIRLKKDKKGTSGLPGPCNSKLLEDLWKYIDCQEPDRDIPFGFKKQVVTVNERYQRLKAAVEE